MLEREALLTRNLTSAEFLKIVFGPIELTEKVPSNNYDRRSKGTN